MSDPQPIHWADVLGLREEIVERQGHAEHLQMSLFDAVYQTTDVPYRDPGYWCDITEPAPRLVGFMADIAHRVGGPTGGKALYWLDQGMGGGKSHALVGLYHLVTAPEEVLRADIGQKVATEAKARARDEIDLSDVRCVVLTADHFTPGVASPQFGPAATLHERFLWALFDAGSSRDARRMYDEHVAHGSDKAALKEALRAAGRPVLILLDELMDYGMHLAGQGVSAAVEAEQAFLSALFDVVDDVLGVALVVVMISTSSDEHGYEGTAGEFRSYVTSRLERNNADRRSVNDPQDFGAIMHRRIFQPVDGELPTAPIAEAWAAAADEGWRSNVFGRLPADRQLSRLADRLERTYPFHPDLLDLVEGDWVGYSGFQQVRSTVAIFSTSAYHWISEHQVGGWAPSLIGVGDIPLHGAADAVLSSGILHGNDRAIVALRQVAQYDITSSDRRRGRAVELDRRLADADDPPAWLAANPHPGERMATALWLYSLVPRSQNRRGATTPELLAAAYDPDPAFGFADADEVLNRLIDLEEEGLGALEIIEGRGGSTPQRYVLTHTKTLRMFHRTAKSRLDTTAVQAFVWERTRKLAAGGAHFDLHLIEAPDDDAPPVEVFADVDQRNSNRLVVIDPRRWMLLNGRDTQTRAAIDALLGVGERSLSPSYAASCVVACVNTQRRDKVLRRAREALAWREVQRDLHGDADADPELYEQAQQALRDAQDALDRDLKAAFQHICYLVRDAHGARVRILRFEDDSETALSGNVVWARLEAEQRAAVTAGLSGAYLHQLLDLSEREYSLAELAGRFWSDPSFPLVPDEQTARRAIFGALQPDADGVAWELVTSDGQPLNPTSPEELAVRATDQYVRLARGVDGGDEQSPAEDEPGGRPEGPLGLTTGDAAGLDEPTVETAYAWHEAVLEPTALTDPQRREALWQLVGALDSVLDPATGPDVQLAELRIRLNAAKGTLRSLRDKAQAAGARWAERDEDDFGL